MKTKFFRTFTFASMLLSAIAFNDWASFDNNFYEQGNEPGGGVKANQEQDPLQVPNLQEIKITDVKVHYDDDKKVAGISYEENGKKVNLDNKKIVCMCQSKKGSEKLCNILGNLVNNVNDIVNVLNVGYITTVIEASTLNSETTKHRIGCELAHYNPGIFIDKLLLPIYHNKGIEKAAEILKLVCFGKVKP